MKRISQITQQQERQIPAFIQKWVDAAETPIDREIATKQLKAIMPERLVLFTDSIDQTIAVIRSAMPKKAEYESRLDSQLESQLRSQLHLQLGSQLQSQLGSQFLQLEWQLGSQLDSQLHLQLDSQLDSQLGSQLEWQLGSQLRSQLEWQLGSHPLRWSYYVSYWWYSWAGYYDFATSIGVVFDEARLGEFNDIMLNAPICAFAGNVVFVIEKPTARWNNGVLSSDQRPAIEFKDGTGIYLLDGVKLTQDQWRAITSRRMRFGDIMQIKDADIRAVALKYNGDAYLSDGELLDEHATAGELFRLTNHDVNRITNKPELYFLRMECPSTGRVFIEGVDPKYAKKHPYALHCQAHNSGVPVELYERIRNHG